MSNDQPSNSEAVGDEAGTVILADRVREVFTAAGLGTIGHDDAVRVDAVELAEGNGGDLDDLREVLEWDAVAVRDLIDEEIGHWCPQCETLSTGWCPTFDSLACTGCLRRADELHEEAQDRGVTL